MDRRGFVKTAIGAGAAGVAGAAGFMGTRALVDPREVVPERLEYWAAQRIAGPTDRGAPLIPIRLNDEGVFEVVPDVDRRHGWSRLHVLAWFKYCGVGGAPGLREDYAGDDVLRFFMPDEKAEVVKPWYRDRLGEPVRPEDFPGDGFGANFTWRTPRDARGPDVLVGSLVRYARHEITRLPQDEVFPRSRALTDREYRFVRDHFMLDHEESTFVACSAHCTHFCCIVGYKEAEALARPRDAWDKLFCTCHSVVYDPREPVADTFFPEHDPSA